MPYINVNVSQALSPQQKDEVKREIAGIIGILPGKTEQVTMIDIEDGKTLYLNGILLDNGAYVDIRIRGNCALAHKQAFTSAVFSTLETLLGIQKEDMYVSIAEYDVWGTRGALT